MIKAIQSIQTKYLQFNRKQWTELCNSVRFTLTVKDIIKIKEINQDLCLKEIKEIYLPLSYILNFFINSNKRQQTILKKFINTDKQQTPYIIGIAGSVAVGKSTIARIMQTLLSYYPESYNIELVTTDDFLYPNRILKQLNLMNQKGFPRTYDINNLINFISKVKAGTPHITTPVYSHVIYDIVPNKQKIITKPDILILEGLNVLQNNNYDKCNLQKTSVLDFIDFSIYVDAPETLLQNWYINRFLKFRHNALSDPHSYFYYYSQLSHQEAEGIARQLWSKINERNLQQHILPTRKYASLIIGKSNKHAVKKLKLRK